MLAELCMDGSASTLSEAQQQKCCIFVCTSATATLAPCLHALEAMSVVVLSTAQVLLIGDSGVGKTCLVMRFISDRFEDQLPSTVGEEHASTHGAGQQRSLLVSGQQLVYVSTPQHKCHY